MKARQIVHGLGWSTLATGINVLAQFAFMAILARHVEPAAFGLLLMANVALRFASFFAQIGTTQTLIQRPEIDARYTTAALVGALAVSTLLYAGVGVAAPVFAWYFKSESLPHVLWVYGASLPLSALGGPPMALLRRAGNFRQASAIDVASYVIGYGITGVACALAGLGVWSLVAAQLMQQALTAVLALAATRYPLAWPLDRTALRSVFGSGSRYSLIGFVEFLWANVESLLIGRWLGTAPLGLFNRAQMLANLPVEQAVGSVSRVMFPALSAMQQERERMADGFLVLLLASGAISGMLSAGISACAADLVGVLLGSRWTAATPVVAILAFGVPACFIYNVCGITLDSLAVLRAKLQLQLALIVVKVVLVVALASAGLSAIAIAVVVAEYLRTLGGLWLICRVLPVSRRTLQGICGALIAAAAVVYLAVTAAAMIAGSMGWPLLLRVTAEAAAGGVAIALLLTVAIRRGGAFAPLDRFDALRRWHHRAHQMLFRHTAT